MEQSRETSLIYSSRVIHTQYFGNVDRDYILDAIDEWCAILNKNKNIRFLIFDYTCANMDNVNEQDAKDIAKKTLLLMSTRNNLKLVGIMPKESDYDITNIWTAYSISNNIEINYENIIILKDLSEAKHIIQEELNR